MDRDKDQSHRAKATEGAGWFNPKMDQEKADVATEDLGAGKRQKKSPDELKNAPPKSLTMVPGSCDTLISGGCSHRANSRARQGEVRDREKRRKAMAGTNTWMYTETNTQNTTPQTHAAHTYKKTQTHKH